MPKKSAMIHHETRRLNEAEFDRRFPHCPATVRALVAKNKWSMTKAAKAAKITNGTLRRAAVDPASTTLETAKKLKLTDQDASAVSAVAHNGVDQAPPEMRSAELAILVFKGTSFERLYDVGLQLGGQWMFKKHFGNQWITVLKMSRRDIEGYLAMVRTYGVETITV